MVLSLTCLLACHSCFYSSHGWLHLVQLLILFIFPYCQLIGTAAQLLIQHYPATVSSAVLQMARYNLMHTAEFQLPGTLSDKLMFKF